PATRKQHTFVLNNRHRDLKLLTTITPQSEPVKGLGDRYNRDDSTRIRNFFPIACTDVPRCLVDPSSLPRPYPAENLPGLAYIRTQQGHSQHQHPQG
ncbi:hypothetical protein BD779DRAFT_1808364, partial [Infundibulicybe gibba]